MGSKIEAKALMRAAGVPVLPDSSTVDDVDEIGYPLLVKASAGGGGRGMRIVEQPSELAAARADAEREAGAAFGDGTVFVERYVRRGRHVEIQVFADSHGTVVSLHERECSIQRRHQKIIEESPSPAVDAVLRRRMADAAVAAARAVGYVGAGTVEFLLEPDGHFWFLEMNTRLQVEHPVTELVTGLDLVELQFAVAEGAPLPAAALDAPLDGHAIEVRLTAEDPAAGYRPSTGTFTRFEVDGAVRLDTGVESGSTVSPYYDSMLAKVIAHGADPRRGDPHAPPTPSPAPACTGRSPTATSCCASSVTRRSPPVRSTPASSTSTRRTDPIVGDERLAAAAVALAEQAANRAAGQRARRAPVGLAQQPGRRPGRRARPRRRAAASHLPPRARGPRRRRRRPLRRHGRDRRTRPRRVRRRWGAASVRRRPGRRSPIRRRRRRARDVHAAPRYPDPDAAVDAGSLVAPMPGTVVRVLVAPGDAVTAGQVTVVIEAMKMEHRINPPAAGTVEVVNVAPGDQVDTGQVLLHVDGGEPA